MTGVVLRLNHPPALRLDLRGVLPRTLAALDEAAIARLPIVHGRSAAALGDFFSVSRVATPDGDDLARLRLEGDCARVDRIGWGLDGGELVVDGAVGDHAGTRMSGGRLTITGSAGLLAGCELSGGRLTVHGDVGDHAAAALPGNADGMRGGEFIVHGRAGRRLGDRMRRGTLLVVGDAGDFAGSRMVAGTLVVGGRCGAHPGWGQRRGSLLLLNGSGRGAVSFEPPPTFVPAGAEMAVAWQLLARDLAALHPALAGLPRRPFGRWLGDLAVDGRGELIVVY